jgi:hypothetical protein
LRSIDGRSKESRYGNAPPGSGGAWSAATIELPPIGHLLSRLESPCQIGPVDRAKRTG